MATCTIIITDNSDGGFSTLFEFDPPLNHPIRRDNTTPAQQIGLALAKHVRAVLATEDVEITTNINGVAQ